MAEPARQLDSEDENQEGRSRPELVHSGERSGPTHTGNLSAVPKPVYDEGGTEPSSPSRSHLRAVENGQDDDTGKGETDSQKPSRDELADKENGAADEPKHEGQLGRGYQKSDQQFGRFSLKGRFNRRKALFGGGLLGTIIAVLMFFTFAAGPFEFIHIAQLMEKFHFSSLQNQQDNRFWKMGRYVRYYQKGTPEKTRMGFLGNKFADTFESKLNASGFTSSYTPKFGYFDGYVIDRNNEKFKGMSDTKIKQLVKDSYGLDAVNGSGRLNGELFVDTSKTGYIKSYKLNYAMLKQADQSKLSAAIGARMFCARAGCTFHPLKKLSANTKAALEKWLLDRDKVIAEGEEALTAKDGSKPQDPKNPDPTQESASESVADTNNGASEAASDKSKFGDFKTSTGTKLLGGGAAAIGVLCIVKSINNDADQIKQTQVILPLIRLGVETMAVGSQVQSGQDVDLSEMGQLSKFLSGTDATGNKSNWSDAESIQAELGHSNTGVAPSKTLTTINSAAPFGFINSIPLLSTACSVGGGILIGGLTLALDFTGVGAVAVNAAGQLAASFLSGPIIDQIAHWLAGNAVDPEAVGADYGNEINYGSKLAANDQAITSGGRELTNNEVYALKNISGEQDDQQFRNKSIAHRLFNPYDASSAVSKLVDRSSPSLSQNAASLGSSFLNIGHMFSSFSSIFVPQSKAATAGYDYGFPTYGFSEAEMESTTANEIPYQNADEVAAILDKSGEGGVPDYINDAKDCFNVNLVQVADDKGGMLWDVQGGPAEAPNFLKLKKSCAETTDPNWLKIRLFIMDTESMNSMSCYQGDGQSCADIGFASEAIAAQ